MKFRNEDVQQMFIYPCFMRLSMVIVFSISILFDLSRVTFTFLIMQIFLSSLNWTIWALGKRFKDKMVYMILAGYLLTQLTIVFTTETIHRSEGEKALHVEQTPMRLFIGFAIHTLLLAPSIWSLALVYVPTYLLTFLYFRIQLSENSHEKFVWNASFLAIPPLVTFWFVFQRRELKRFFQ